MDQNHQEYDVVIMGAGFAGICQARHLLLNVPGVKVALVDPRPEQRRDKDMKVGESMVEIAALFVCKELGLHDYMIENHAPKAGLNFHWAKRPDKTESLDDYYHVWANRQTPIASFHMNRAKFERDVLQMTKQMGAVHLRGHVTDVDLPAGDASKTVRVKTDQGDVQLKCKHVVDAAGRRFIIGRKKDNLLTAPKDLDGVDNASAWVRVRNVDRSIFVDRPDPEGGSSVSRYYATNHWMGHGHWAWMIPTCTDTMELSVGVVYHKDVIQPEQMGTREKFYAFLKKNHHLLYRVVTSGDEVDFQSWSRIAHRSREMFSPDNWYVIGDAAYILDAFYSYGTTTIALAVEGVTEIIRAKLAGEPDAEEKRAAYNDFNLSYARGINLLIREHSKQLGHASIMSWRIYFEYMWWFGVHIPMYIGKWHLNPKFARRFASILQGNIDRLFPAVYDQFNTLIRRGKNLGILDCYRADQLLGHYSTLKHYDDFLENTKLEPLRCNVFAGMTRGYLYIALWYLKFSWKGFGLAGVFAPRNLRNLSRLIGLSARASVNELVYRFKTRRLPDSALVAQMRREFQNYRHKATLKAWS